MLPHIVILHAKTAIYQLKQALVFLHIVILHTILRKASHENTVFINCTQLQGFPIDSHTFAQVRHMIKIWHTMRWLYLNFLLVKRKHSFLNPTFRLFPPDEDCQKYYSQNDNCFFTDGSVWHCLSFVDGT